MSIAPLLIAVFPVFVIVAALKDVTSYTIPNWISLVLIAAFAPAAVFGVFTPGTLWLHLLVGVVALIAGMAMFAAGWIGGGDAKLFAAAGLWIGWSAALPFLFITAIAGGALALLLLSLRTGWMRAHLPSGPKWVERLREPDGPAPYGVAIAVGALLAFPQAILAVA